MTYFVIAGEASGDSHAARLLCAIRSADSTARFVGMGGDNMQAAGCQLVQHISNMAFMGVVAVMSNLGKIRRNFSIARNALLAEKPDVLILVDYPSFNLKMAAFCRKHLPKTKIVYYIPPKVWAWKTYRIHQVMRLANEVLSILPFEEAFYQRYDYKITYVGNPTKDSICQHPIEIYQNPTRRPYIAILPGSRRSEIKHCLNKMLDAARHFADYDIVVAAAPNISSDFYAPYLHEGEQLVSQSTYAVVKGARVAIVNSGTATLETALIRVPQVAVYHIAMSYPWLVRLIRPIVFKIPYFTLVNLVAGREVIQELIADRFTVSNITAELKRLLSDDNYRQTILRGYDEIDKRLGSGQAADNAAQIIRRCIGKE